MGFDEALKVFRSICQVMGYAACIVKAKIYWMELVQILTIVSEHSDITKASKNTFRNFPMLQNSNLTAKSFPDRWKMKYVPNMKYLGNEQLGSCYWTTFHTSFLQDPPVSMSETGPGTVWTPEKLINFYNTIAQLISDINKSNHRRKIHVLSI